MADATYSLVNNATGEKTELPAIKGTLGPVGLDVGAASTSLRASCASPRP